MPEIAPDSRGLQDYLAGHLGPSTGHAMLSVIGDSIARSLSDELDTVLHGLFRRYRWPTIERTFEDVRQDCLLSVLQWRAASDEADGCPDQDHHERLAAWLYQALNSELRRCRTAAKREKLRQRDGELFVEPDLEAVDRAFDNEELLNRLLGALRPWERSVITLRYGLAQPRGFAYSKCEVARILKLRLDRVTSCEAYSVAKSRKRSERLGLDWTPS